MCTVLLHNFRENKFVIKIIAFSVKTCDNMSPQSRQFPYSLKKCKKAPETCRIIVSVGSKLNCKYSFVKVLIIIESYLFLVVLQTMINA